MRITTRAPAGANEILEDEALAETIGKKIPLRLGDRTLEAEVVEAVVVEDGQAALLTLEIDGADPSDFGIFLS